MDEPWRAGLAWRAGTADLKTRKVAGMNKFAPHKRFVIRYPRNVEQKIALAKLDFCFVQACDRMLIEAHVDSNAFLKKQPNLPMSLLAIGNASVTALQSCDVPQREWEATR